MHYRRQENYLILLLLSLQFAETQNQNNEKIRIGCLPRLVPRECLTVVHSPQVKKSFGSPGSSYRVREEGRDGNIHAVEHRDPGAQETERSSQSLPTVQLQQYSALPCQENVTAQRML